ncbi:hypothetical protein [Burkholderia ubonensis]|uniref:hypothetical protein n=1 Tax=Burkholderia ubonensis TaxID=101571 RepID=UPI0007532AFF|nr:hypothetical protein [Burkholderia ubonensis]KVD79281.1 hypothetical protein WI89_29155 [Burkholderia ubonensis]KWB61382.1 hypothetical protein WL38_25330 [Burkholderia ubonensis]KWB67829.1 hypothetical protein WL39_09350 [Burkholderia ubonensis]
MTTKYLTDHLLIVRAIHIDGDKAPDLTAYHPYAFTSTEAVEPGQFISDAAVCGTDTRKIGTVLDQTGKTAAQVRAALGLTVK